MDDDGRSAGKVPGESRRGLAGDLTVVEEPGSSVNSMTRHCLR